jgi:hypothetical protein
MITTTKPMIIHHSFESSPIPPDGVGVAPPGVGVAAPSAVEVKTAWYA